MEVQGHLWIFGKFKASLGYMTLYIFFFFKGEQNNKCEPYVYLKVVLSSLVIKEHGN